MPDFDFRVIPSNPVIDAVDRRGQQYMLGLGGAAPTDFSAGVQGLKEGLAFGADLSAKIQETTRINDPETLAAQQLQRELANKQLEEAIITAQITNRFEPAKIASDISYKDALTTGQGLNNQITARFGMEEAAAKIAQSRAAAASSYASAANAPIAALQKNAAFLKSVTPTGKESDSGTPFAPFGNNNSVLPEPSIAGPSGFVSELDAAKQQLFQDYQSMTSSGEQGQVLAQRDAISSTTAGLKLEAKKSQDRLRNKSVAEDNYNLANRVLEDVNFEGKYSAEALANPVSVLSQLHGKESSPVDKATYAAQIADVIEFAGGPENIQTTIDQMPEGTEKENARKVMSKAIVDSGNVNFYTPDQKAIVGAGLSPEHAADPTETYNKLDQLITSGTTNIDDPDFNSAMVTSRYVIAASAASKNGSQSYTIKGGSVPLQGGTSDLAGGDQSSAIGIVFTGQDGAVAYAPDPGNDPKLRSQFNLVNKVASRQQVSIPAQNAVNQNLSQIQNLQQQNQQVAQNAARPNIQTEEAEERNPPIFGTSDPNEIPKSIEQRSALALGKSSKGGTLTLKEREVGIEAISKYDASTKGLSEQVAKNQAEFIETDKQASTLDTAIKIAINTDNAAFIGADGQLDRASNKLLKYVGYSDEDKNRIENMFNMSTMLEILKRMRGQVKGFDTPAEKQQLKEGTASIKSEFATVQNYLETLRADAKVKREINNIITLGQGRQMPESFINQTIDRYLNDPDAKPLISNPKAGLPNEPDFIENTDMLSAEQFVGMAPKPRKQPLTSGGATGSFAPTSPNTNTPDVANTAEAQTEADIAPGSSSSSSSSGGVPSANIPFTTSPTTTTTTTSTVTPSTGPTAQGQAFAQSVDQEQAPPTSKIADNLDISDPKVAPAYRALVDELRNLTGIESVDATMNALDYLGDSIFFNKGGRVVDSLINRTDLSPKDAQLLTQAQQQAREEFAKDNKITALGLDALATVIDFSLGGQLIKAGGALASGALQSIAEVPVIGQKIVQGAEAVGKVASKAADIATGAGKVFSTPGSKIIPQALFDGTILALREENPDLGGALKNILLAGGANQALVPIKELTPSIIQGIQRIISDEKGAINISRKLKQHLEENGVPKETIAESLQLAKEKNVSILGTLRPEVLDTVTQVAKSPAGREEILKTAGARAARAEEELVSNVRSLNLENVRTANDLTITIKESVKTQLDNEISKATTAATGQKNEAAAKLASDLVEGNIKDAQETLNLLYGAVGKDAPNIKGSIGGAARGEAELVVPKKLEDIQKVKEIIDTAASGEESVFRQFAEKTFDKLDSKITQSLENELIRINPNEAPRFIEQVRLKRGIENEGVNNTIGFYDDLRQVFKDQKGTTGSPTFEAMEDAVIKAGDKALEQMGLGKGYYSGFVEQWGKLKEVGKLVDIDIKKTEIIEDALNLGKTNAYEGIYKLGERSPERLAEARSFDEAFTRLQSFSEGKGIEDISAFAKELTEAQKFIKDTDPTFFAKKLMREGEGSINRLKRVLGNEGKEIIEQGVMRVVTDNIIASGEVGLSAKELVNAKKILTPEQLKALDVFTERRVAIKQAQDAFQKVSGTPPTEESSVPIVRSVVGFARKHGLGGLVTAGVGAGVGIATGISPWVGAALAEGLYTITKYLGSRGISAEAKLAITKALVQSPENVNKFFEDTLNLQKKELSPKTMDNMKRAFLVLWSVEKDVKQRKSNELNREAKARRANRR